MGKHLWAKAHLATLNEVSASAVTYLTCSMVDETALAILNRHGRPGIAIVRLQSHLIFDVQGIPY